MSRRPWRRSAEPSRGSPLPSGRRRPSAAIALLERQVREEAARAEVLGAALFVNVTVRVEDEARPTDAILVRVEHRDGRSYERIIPYVVGAGAVRLLEVTTSAREPTLLGLGLGSGGRAASGL